MKAALCKEYGPPRSLVVEEVEAPEPGRGEVKLRVHACGVNFPDILMMAGKYQSRPDMPFSPGGEVSGEIITVGEGVEGLATGQRVLGMAGHGGMAEEICLPAAAVVPIPDNMDYETAAGFILTYGTSYHALKQRARLQEGETLLVLGAAGGVGLAAVELGRLMGARVIAAASSREKLDLAGEYGATDFVNYTEENLKDRVKELTGGRGVDVIYDPVGGELFDQCMRSIAWKGRVLVIGFASGEIPKVPVNLALLKGCEIVGVFWGAFTQREPEVHRENTRELLEFATSGKLKPHISATFPLEQAGEALAVLAERKALGKVIVRID
ncbi:MAG: NADPH:quinone oxidoreductase family protein [Gammaproteobacteria bacterium]